MKRAFLIVAALACGCHQTAESIHPFFTESLTIAPPSVVGEWDQWRTQRDGTEATESTWRFADGAVRVYRDSGPADFAANFFQIDKQVYCDLQNKDNARHALYITRAEPHTLQLIELDLEWLTNAIAHNAISLPKPEWISDRPGSSNLVFTASSEQWVGFLRQQGTNTQAFSDGYNLKRSVQNFVPRRRS